MARRSSCTLLAFALLMNQGCGQKSSPIDGGGGPQVGAGCEPLPAPAGKVIDITPSNIGQLNELLSTASPGDTFSFADGTYSLNGAYIWISRPGVTLRSASGNRDAVVLDGGYATPEVITIAASDVTVASLTIRQPYTHGIHVTTTEAGHTLRTLIYDVRVVDPRQQAIKINPGADGKYADEGVVACCALDLTDAGRGNVDTVHGGCYTGGVDAHQARDWVVRDNRIQGFWCPQGLSEHAVHFWRGSRGTVVERNVLRDNARGVGLGMATSGAARQYPDGPCPGVVGYVDHYTGVVRNNFVFASRDALLASGSGFDCGICLWSACGARVVHNTVASTRSPFSSIEWRFAPSASLEIANNLATHALLERDGASASLAGNLQGASLDLFVDGAGGDLHLAATAAAALDQGVALAGGVCTSDFDGDQRDGTPDVGADERR
jgi:hypothetical protein